MSCVKCEGCHFFFRAKDNFTFKCHRSTVTAAGQTQDIYAVRFPCPPQRTPLSPPPPQVNCIAFHPSYGTLATVGGDGRFSFWDKDARTKLKTSEAMEQPISSCAFNFNGNIFAYSVSYDWSKVCGHCGPRDSRGTSTIPDHCRGMSTTPPKRRIPYSSDLYKRK